MMIMPAHRRLVAAAVAALVFTTASAHAQSTETDDATAEPESPPITRIEEDWSVLVRNPDPKVDSPQVTNVLTPDGGFTGSYGVVELNHGSKSEFFEGGVQIQAWSGDHYIKLRNSESYGVLTRRYDRLVYTVAMSIEDDQLVFEVKNGRSRTWGRFGTDGELRTSLNTNLTSLADYSPDHSLSNASVNFGAHRVLIMYLRRVRVYSGDDLLEEDRTLRTLHRFQTLVQDVSLEEYEKNPEFYNVEVTQ